MPRHRSGWLLMVPFGFAAVCALTSSSQGSASTRDRLPEVAAQAFFYEQEAEDSDLTAPMAVGEDEAASAGQYVYCPVKGEAGETARASFSVELPVEDEYYLWARVMGVAWPHNSFYVSFDGGQEMHYEIPPLLGEWAWRWDLVHLADHPPRTYLLGPGTHTLSFRAREHNARLDKIVLTNDPDYRPPDASVSEPFIMYQQEAESATLTSPMSIEDDIYASDCRYVSSPIGPSAGAATLTFDVFLTDQYHLWCRAMGVGYTHNSFFVSVDDGPEMQYEIPMLEGEWRWTWDRVHDMEDPAAPITLTAGLHTVSFRARESDARLDVVVLINDPSFFPSGITPCPVSATPTSSLTPSVTPTSSDTPEPTTPPRPSNTPTASPTPTATCTPTSTPTPSSTPAPDRRTWLPLILG